MIYLLLILSFRFLHLYKVVKLKKEAGSRVTPQLQLVYKSYKLKKEA